MSTDTLAGDRLHPIGPVLDSVAEVAIGFPPASLGGDDTAAWYPASWITDPDGPVLRAMLDDAARRWSVGPHAAAALAFKGYAWAATLPVLVGWARQRRVPLPETGRIRVGISADLPYVRFDLADAPVALLPDDPAAAHPAARVVDDPAALLDAARAALVDDHLAAVIAALHGATRVGERLLWGTVAEAIAQPALLMPDGTAADRVGTARMLLESFGERVQDLIDVVDGPRGPRVRRRTCCLWFTASDGRGRYCASCCVTRPERTL
ncbi:MAG TPA: ferric iron reductase [Jiangellaceae bacterium]|nr:ferric iron reductase [Jiangellaceae bacterium]